MIKEKECNYYTLNSIFPWFYVLTQKFIELQKMQIASAPATEFAPNS